MHKFLHNQNIDMYSPNMPKPCFIYEQDRHLRVFFHYKLFVDMNMPAFL